MTFVPPTMLDDPGVRLTLADYTVKLTTKDIADVILVHLGWGPQHADT